MKPDQDTKNSTWTTIKRKSRRVLLWIISLVVIIVLIFVYWNYFYTYSEGYRAGLLQKFSRKGTLFKTFEGELILSSVTTTNNTAIASEKFLFSVSDDSLAVRLDTLQGRNVIVHYRQKNSPLFWRGDSPYLVDGIKPR